MENDNSESKNEDNKIIINKIISIDDIKNDDIMIRSIASSKKVSKKKSEYIMPTKENYSILLKVNYTIKQLKEIANHYKIKIWGFLTPILTKKNKERTNKMDISQKIREIKWFICLTFCSIHDSIAV